MPPVSRLLLRDCLATVQRFDSCTGPRELLNIQTRAVKTRVLWSPSHLTSINPAALLALPSTLARGGQSHKEVTNPFLRLYYSKVRRGLLRVS